MGAITGYPTGFTAECAENAENKLACTLPHESHGGRGPAGTIATTTDPNS